MDFFVVVEFTLFKMRNQRGNKIILFLLKLNLNRNFEFNYTIIIIFTDFDHRC